MTLDETRESRGAPRLDAVIASTNARAARIEERNSYVVTGFVLTHPDLGKKAVVDMAAVRWFPNVDEFLLMMTGRKITPGPGIPPPGWTADELIAAAPMPVPVAAAAAPARPLLTAHPSARLHETTEEALGALARELGCAFNEDIPHNSGWFVPGRPTACASAYDAIRGLVESLKSGGTVYEGKPATASIAAAPERGDGPAAELPQGALF